MMKTPSGAKGIEKLRRGSKPGSPSEEKTSCDTVAFLAEGIGNIEQLKIRGIGKGDKAKSSIKAEGRHGGKQKKKKVGCSPLFSVGPSAGDIAYRVNQKEKGGFKRQARGRSK